MLSAFGYAATTAGGIAASPASFRSLVAGLAASDVVWAALLARPASADHPCHSKVVVASSHSSRSEGMRRALTQISGCVGVSSESFRRYRTPTRETPALEVGRIEYAGSVAEALAATERLVTQRAPTAESVVSPGVGGRAVAVKSDTDTLGRSWSAARPNMAITDPPAHLCGWSRGVPRRSAAWCGRRGDGRLAQPGVGVAGVPRQRQRVRVLLSEQPPSNRRRRQRGRDLVTVLWFSASRGAFRRTARPAGGGDRAGGRRPRAELLLHRPHLVDPPRRRGGGALRSGVERGRRDRGLFYSVATGELLAGLFLSSAGLFSGAPKTAGSSSYTVTVSDADHLSATFSVTQSALVGPSVTTATLGSAYRGEGFSATLAASAGTPPYSWAIGAPFPVVSSSPRRV